MTTFVRAQNIISDGSTIQNQEKHQHTITLWLVLEVVRRAEATRSPEKGARPAKRDIFVVMRRSLNGESIGPLIFFLVRTYAHSSAVEIAQSIKFAAITWTTQRQLHQKAPSLLSSQTSCGLLRLTRRLSSGGRQASFRSLNCQCIPSRNGTSTPKQTYV